jgi:hypothetical protein
MAMESRAPGDSQKEGGMTAEVKLRTLAMADATLQADLGAPPRFRWYDTAIPQGVIQQGACVRVLRVSTVLLYAHSLPPGGSPVTTPPGGLLNVTQPRFQIDVMALDPEIARLVAADVIAFMATADLASFAQFSSPALTPRQFPNFLLNQRHGADYQEQPPISIETLDFRVFHLEGDPPPVSPPALAPFIAIRGFGNG